MIVRPLCPSDLPVVYELFKRVTAPLVHGLPAIEEEFCVAFRGSAPHLRSSVVLVAEEGDALSGLLRAGLFKQVPDRWAHATNGDGMLFGPFVMPHNLGAGESLLKSGLGYLRERGVTRAFAFDHIEGAGAPFFNAGWAALSERLPHIAQLYGHAGFRIRAREFCLRRDADSPIMIPQPAEPPRPLAIAHETRNQGRNAVRLLDRGLFVGGCYYSRMFPGRSRNPEAMIRGYIDGLSVEQSMQGRGYGRLLLLHAIQRLHAMGCETIILTTAADNFRAQNLYYSLGFRVVDSCITLAGPTTRRPPA